MDVVRCLYSIGPPGPTDYYGSTLRSFTERLCTSPDSAPCGFPAVRAASRDERYFRRTSRRRRGGRREDAQAVHPPHRLRAGERRGEEGEGEQNDRRKAVVSENSADPLSVASPGKIDP